MFFETQLFCSYFLFYKKHKRKRIIIIFIKQFLRKMKEQHYKEDKLWAYLDKDLSAEEVAQIEQHLNYCTTCLEHLNALKAFDNEVAATVVEVPSMRFSKNVMELIEEEVSLTYAPIIKPFWQKLLATGFGSLLLALVFLPTFVPASSSFPLVTQIEQTTQSLLATAQMLNQPAVFLVVASLLAFWLLFAADKFLLSKVWK